MSNDLREYTKMRYAGNCKCGQCQLVPLAVINANAEVIDVLETLVKACDASGVTQVPAGSQRPDLERLRAIIDSAKCLLP